MASKIIAILFLSILIDFLEFAIILPLLPKILTYYGSGTGASHVRSKLAVDRSMASRMSRIRSTIGSCPWCNSLEM